MSHAPKSIKENYEEVIPSVYAMVPNELYHSIDGISSSNIKEIGKSIAHYHYSKEHQKKQTDAMLKGSAFHDMVLLPDVYEATYMMGPTITKTSKKYKQCVLDNPHKTVLPPRMIDDLEYMRDALYKNPSIREILESDTILREVSIWSKDTTTGLLRKCRPDIIVDGVVFDLKTSIVPHYFLKAVYEFKYHVSAPYYVDICRDIGMNTDEFQFIVVGSKPPYLTGIYRLNDDLMEEGRDYIRSALDTYANYMLSSDDWDGLPQGREVVTL